MAKLATDLHFHRCHACKKQYDCDCDRTDEDVYCPQCYAICVSDFERVGPDSPLPQWARILRAILYGLYFAGAAYLALRLTGVWK